MGRLGPIRKLRHGAGGCAPRSQELPVQRLESHKFHIPYEPSLGSPAELFGYLGRKLNQELEMKLRKINHDHNTEERPDRNEQVALFSPFETEENILKQRIVTLYGQGLLIKTIAERMELCPETVSRYLHEAGLVTKPPHKRDA